MASPRHVTVELVYDHFIGDGPVLDALQQLLVEHAPRWCERARVTASHEPRPLDLSEPGALRREVLREAGLHGPLSEYLVDRYGPGDERLNGSAEVRGATRDLVLVPGVDEHAAVRWRDGSVKLNNDVVLQLQGGRIQGQPLPGWAMLALRELAGAPTPAWGAIRALEEYDAKVMSDEPGVSHAVGRDLGRYLPGLFTVNLFGPPYVELIGRDRLLSAPAPIVEEVGDGVLVALGDDPRRWSELAEVEDAVLDHLGREHFFAKPTPPARPRSPDWGV